MQMLTMEVEYTSVINFLRRYDQCCLWCHLGYRGMFFPEVGFERFPGLFDDWCVAFE